MLPELVGHRRWFLKVRKVCKHTGQARMVSRMLLTYLRTGDGHRGVVVRQAVEVEGLDLDQVEPDLWQVVLDGRVVSQLNRGLFVSFGDLKKPNVLLDQLSFKVLQ